MRRVIIVDYNLGNIFSLKNACERVGLDVTVSADPVKIRGCHQLVLPGVGAFGVAVENLKQLDLIDPVIEHAKQGKPLVGICLGLQLLFSRSEEFGNNLGLDLIPGVVKRFPDVQDGEKLRIPHVGWNVLNRNASGSSDPLFFHLNEDPYAYFVHSYYVEPIDPSIITAVTEYHGFRFCAAIRKDNIVGMQFHPEKSGPKGLKMLANILNGVW